MITNLQNKLKFIELMDEMKNIERAIRLKNWREETNAEHSFHLAMMVVILIEDFPKLDSLKCVKMALFHDLVEIFAGDTVIFDEKMEKTKKQRELKAIWQLEEVLWKEDFENIKILIEEYENRSSLEAEFVHQIDKIQPIIQIVMEWGSSWHEYKIDKDKLINKKYKQINDKFWLMQLLDWYFEKAEKENMFYKEKNEKNNLHK